MEKFKAGDWVRDTRSGMKRPVVQLQPNCIALTDPEEHGKHYIKWIPEIGTYQWFAKDDKSEPIFAKLVGITYTNDSHTDISWYITDRYQDQWAGMGTVATNMFKYCTPFIGELPQYYSK